VTTKIFHSSLSFAVTAYQNPNIFFHIPLSPSPIDNQLNKTPLVFSHHFRDAYQTGSS
jgi:hypothetical protein